MGGYSGGVGISGGGSGGPGSNAYQLPYIVNIFAPLSGVEYTYTFPDSTRRYLIRTRQSSAFKIAFILGDTISGDYVNIRPGCYYQEFGVSINVPLAIYIQTTQNNETIEILYWS